MNQASFDQLHSLPAHKIDLAQTQTELDRLWAGCADLADGQNVTRACMSNLIIYCDNDAQRLEIIEAIPAIVVVHPARVILLTGEGHTDDPGIEVFVSGYYRALGEGWQVCAEQISVVSDASQRRLPSVTRSQLVGDLPTSLWWASQQPPPFAGKLFYKLADLSDQVIYDSIGWTNPSKGMQAMSRWVSAERGEYVIFNLAWRRLKPWRKILSQVLDPVVQPGALARVSQVSIEHGPHALAMAMLLLGWLASRLGWQAVDASVKPGRQTTWRFDARGHRLTVIVNRLDSGAAAPQRLTWRWQEEREQQQVVFAQLDHQRLGILEQGSDVPVRVIAAPDLTRCELVSAQMAHRSRDKLFEESLEKGQQMTSVLST